MRTSIAKLVKSKMLQAACVRGCIAFIAVLALLSYYSTPSEAQPTIGASRSKSGECRQNCQRDHSKNIIIYNDNSVHYGGRTGRRESYYYPYGYERYRGQSSLQDRSYAPANGSRLYNEYQYELQHQHAHPPGLDMSPLRR